MEACHLWSEQSNLLCKNHTDNLQQFFCAFNI